MANIDTSACSCNSPTHNSNTLLHIGNDGAYSLDTLETSCHQPITKQRETLVGITLQKRANVKNSLALIDVNSPFQDKYWDTYWCGKILLQEYDRYHRKLCRRRWCTTCSRIRTAEYINGYSHLLQEFIEPTYVVLTMQNCKGRELKSMYGKIVEVLRKARRNYSKATGCSPSGIWTFECTYNDTSDTYHPHINIVFDTYAAAQYTYDYWMSYWKNKGKNKVSHKAQSIQHLSNGKKGLKEVFKYTVKHMTDVDNKAEAQDHIFRTIHGKRVVQPFGKLRKAKPIKLDIATDVVSGGNKIDVYEYQDDTGHYENSRFETLVTDSEVDSYLHEKARRKRNKQQYMVDDTDTIENRLQPLKMAHNGK